MIESQDFREFINLLNENRVKYLVIGGYAVNFHGYVRYTDDLDIWISRDKKNLLYFKNSSKDFGLEISESDIKDFEKKNVVLQFGIPPLRIDILSKPDGIIFEDCYSRKEVVIIDMLKINFISLDDIIRNKKASGRVSDKKDLERLKLKKSI